MSVLNNLYPRLTNELACMLKSLKEADRRALEEIRIYCGRHVELVFSGERRMTELVMDEGSMAQLLSALSGMALYRFEREMAEGFLPLPGGHRAGVCGSMARQADGTWRMSAVTSVCLRIARHVEGASLSIRPYLTGENGRARRVLLLGAPGCGKTTVLRDAALYLGKRMHTAVADEREELFAAEGTQGLGVDVLRGMDKAHAFSVLIRAMAPQVIVCDELGREEDVLAVLDAARCGVGVLASAHADGFEDLIHRPVTRKLFEAGVFERYIHLGKHGCVNAVMDEAGNMLESGRHAVYGELGNRSDGDDRREQRRLSLV